MSQELKHLSKTFNFQRAHILAFGITEEEARNMLISMRQFGGTKQDKTEIDGPDMVSVFDGHKIGIEHFEYDASPKGRKGSFERKLLEKAAKQFEKEAREALKTQPSCFLTKQLDNKNSIKALKNSFSKNFLEHKPKTQYYRKNISSNKIWFLAEDSSAMTPMVYSFFLDGFPEYPLLPVFYDEMQKQVLSSDIEGIILASTFPVSNYFVFVRNDEQSFRAFSDHYHFDEKLPIQVFSDSNIGFSAFTVPTF